MIFTDSTRPFTAAGPVGSPLTRLSCSSPAGCTSAPFTATPLTVPVPPSSPACVTPTGAVSTLPKSSPHDPKNWYDEFSQHANAAIITTWVAPMASRRPHTCHSPCRANRGHDQTSSPTHTAARAAITYTVVSLVRPIPVDPRFPTCAVSFTQKEG